MGWVLVFCALFVVGLFGLLMLLARLEPPRRTAVQRRPLAVPAAAPVELNG